MSIVGWFSLPSTASSGESDQILADLVMQLCNDGFRLAGAVQFNPQTHPDCACDMELAVIGSAVPQIRISQSLGPGASGCRLDPGALELAAEYVAQKLSGGAELLILPKFGKQEAIGRGFCQVIAQAIEAETPVLLHVAEEQVPAFQDFVGDLAHRVAPEDLIPWCHSISRQPA